MRLKSGHLGAGLVRQEIYEGLQHMGASVGHNGHHGIPFCRPGTVAGLIPWWITPWRVHSSIHGFTALRAIGILLIAAGAVVLLECFARFPLEGIGTPAPIYPTRHLIVRGSYRYVRNPMYVAVVLLILGQSLFFGDFLVFAYGLFCWILMHIFVVLYEEPTLQKSFAAEYSAFRQHVPRWLPRFSPWQRGIQVDGN
jgi:protein-S-isoprenylcysteine O-methyltransferase Ste14